MDSVSVIPSLLAIGYIFATKRVLEALVIGTLAGFVIARQQEFFSAFTEALQKVLMGETMAWLFVVCGLMGSMIALIERSGGTLAFSRYVAQRAQSRSATLLATWALGMAIFIDDYLSSLAVGSSMSPNTDRHKVSREMLAYVVDSTAASACVLIPISTWAVFVSRLLVDNQVAPPGEGTAFFIRTIPFNFYAWCALIIVPLVIVRAIPTFGPMRDAEERALTTGELAPPGSERIDIRAGAAIHSPEDASALNFVGPMVLLVAATVYFDLDMMKGVIATIGFMFIFYVARGTVTPAEFADEAVRGIRNMLFPLLLMVAAFTFAEANEAVGFTQFVIDSVTPLLSPEFLPVTVFITLAAVEFVTGTNWGMYIIAFPIVIPLAVGIGADPIIAVAAVLSAGVFGSHICFFSDATILSSAACGCDNYRHAITQMPFGFLAAVLAALAFLVVGLSF
jgi:tetracycline resistance efflux pump